MTTSVLELPPSAPCLPLALWVEPATDLVTNRVLLRTLENYSVTTATSHREVFDLRNFPEVSVAILSDAFGLLMLSAIARCVRSQWPAARILLLRRKQPVLEDHLYDDAIEYRSIPKGLVEALVRLSSNATVYRSSVNLPQ
jgi:hypothetical protein